MVYTSVETGRDNKMPQIELTEMFVDKILVLMFLATIYMIIINTSILNKIIRKIKGNKQNG
ncbi:hypothetical protein ES702_01448 [subsurface metagenome]